MQDLFESPALESDSGEIFAGYRGPAGQEPQQHLSGFFDAEVYAFRERVSALGSEAVSFALKAPAGLFGWFFETERPWWPSSRE